MKIRVIDDVIDHYKNIEIKQAKIDKTPTNPYQEQLEGVINYDIYIQDHGAMALRIRKITKNI
jgi:protein-tyrosine phosphatase